MKNVGEGLRDWKEENFGITLRRKKEAGRGWVAAYSLQAWPRDNNSRR